jgi:signal transduction histidine kinase
MDRAISSFLSPRAATAISAGIVVCAGFADFLLPSEINAPVAYCVAVGLCAWTRSRAAVWTIAFCSVILALLGLLLGPAHTGEPAHSSAWINLLLVVLAVLTVAAIVHLWILLIDHLERNRTSLERQNDELATREEEIARQNEELQSQTEELERQSEELRVTNEELARRERALQSLLDLSRSLTAGLSQDETLSRICNALGQLVNHQTAASAILLREADQLRVRCHYGFGPGGLARDLFPFGQSFARLVVEKNQWGYIEDLELRPDLLMPVPKDQAPPRSVLAAPLRVRGTAIGTLEVYSHEKTVWSEEQIALVESVAAQTSISLESAALFEEIENQRRRFETVIRTLPVGVAVSNSDHTEVRLNPAGAAMLNLPTDANPVAPEFSGHFQVFKDSKPLERGRLPLRRACHGEIVQSDEIEILFPGGRRMIVLSSASPFRDRDGKIVGAVDAFADITALKQLQREIDQRRREAEEASVRKTRFLAAVSHDIRTPANAISLMAELIRRTASNPALASQVPQMAAELQSSASAMVELVSDVLDVARFDTGRIELQESEFALSSLVSDEARQLLPVAGDKRLVLEVDLASPPVHLRADRIKLGRVIANLLANAIKFTREGGVRISCGMTDKGEPCVSVSDTGIGIAPQHIPYIFDEFFQLRNPERDRNKGSGLGLAICKRLVEAMGGSISVSSTPDKGSTFAVILPPFCVLPANPAAIADKHPATPPGSLAGLRLLIVEDHAQTRSATSRLLAAEGAIILEAPDGKTCLDLLYSQSPQVLLLDLMLPDISGQDILQTIAVNRPSSLQTIVVLTGELMAADPDQLKALGVAALCPKPLDLSLLLECIASARQDRA